MYTNPPLLTHYLLNFFISWQMFGKKISAENLRERREKGTFSQREIARSVCVIAVFHVQMQCKGPVKQISTRPLIISFSNSMYE
jgi:hypothetical protein